MNKKKKHLPVCPAFKINWVLEQPCFSTHSEDGDRYPSSDPETTVNHLPCDASTSN